MAAKTEIGSRLVITLIDQYASEDPSRPWAVVPIDDQDLSKGFKDLTYGTLANAINYTAFWLQRNLPSATTFFETIAYAGPKDIRYSILALAVAKIGRKLLLPSPFASVAAQAHLVKTSECKAFLYGGPFQALIDNVLASISDKEPAKLQIPELSDMLSAPTVEPIPFGKSWDDAKDDPWMIFHTSGTTGFPKLITYTHQMMASIDKAELMPDAHIENLNNHTRNKRLYTPLPSLHVIGSLISLQFPVYLGATLVIGPTTAGPTTPSIAQATILHGKVQTAILPPALIDSLSESEAGLDSLRNLDYLYFGGAPLLRKTADKLLGHVPVKPGLGSTENGVYFLKTIDEHDWEWYAFRDSMGIEMRCVTDELYEPVFVRREELARWQQVFLVFPELQEFPTKDLFAPHPSKPDLWKYIGRTDDMIAFSHGEDLYAAGVEETIVQHADVAAVVVGGQGRARPFVLVEWREGLDEARKTVGEIWPVIERANEKCSDLVKMTRELVLFTRPEKKLVRTTKGSVARRDSEKLYAEEIETLYS